MRIVGLGLLGALCLAGCTTETDSCVARGTAIATPDGPRPVERVRTGDRIYCVDPRTGRRIATRVLAVRKDRRPCVRIETASGRSIRVTREHPFLTSSGTYRRADRLLSCELAVSAGRGLDTDQVVGCRPVRGLHDVYDLTVEAPQHNFVAAGFVVHNKVFPLTLVESVIPVVEDAATGASADVVRGAEPESTGPLPLTLTLESSDAGVATVLVTAGSDMDAVYVTSVFESTDGYWRLTIDPPAASIRVRITSDDPEVCIGASLGSDVGPPVRVAIR